jgi:23S rRNA pseudouridine1911/1915/1917 synthase
MVKGGKSAADYVRSKYNEFQVEQPMQLLDFIMKALNGISRSKAKAILSGGGISVDKRRETQFNYELQPGMLVQISKHKSTNDLHNHFVKLLYEDRWIVVIEKSAGILSMGSTTSQFCVKSVLDQYFKSKHLKCTAHVVHRLDRDTSGIMVYAKDMETEQILEDNWHEIVTDRRYVAVVSGRMEQDRGDVESWLKDNSAYITFSSPTDNGGKYALTHFHTLKRNDLFSLVDCKLETGRKNQIRVHMQDLGHPIIGDVKYGNGVNPIGRLGLHAYRLFFQHPMTGEPMQFETPFPADFRKLFDTPKESPQK